MKNIQPITALRNTAQLEKDLKEIEGPMFITKNGYGHLVILTPEFYESHIAKDSFASAPSPRRNKEGKKLEEAPSSDPLGFVRVRASSIEVSVCGVRHNEEKIKEAVLEAEQDGVAVLTLPELCLTGYTCGDMFFTATLHQAVEKSLVSLKKWSAGHHIFFVVGAPLSMNNCYYNCGVVFFNGEILGIIPKSFLPNYGEFYELRHFTPAPKENTNIEIQGTTYPFGIKFIFVDENYLKLKIGIEICEDMWVPNTPSTVLALGGADLILNLSASNEVVGKKEYRKSLVSMTSSRLCSAYVYADAGAGESTTDLVFAGHNIIAENAKILAESPLFEMKSATADVDLEKILAERRKMTSFGNEGDNDIEKIFFSLPLNPPKEILRHYSKNPFIPEGKDIDLERVKLVLRMQEEGLIKRLLTVKQKKVFVALSGGLDSTLALLVAVEAFKLLGYDLSGVNAITLPAFGTSQRTHDNAKKLADELGVHFEEINIKESILKHFDDIAHDPKKKDVTYENAQARMRTMIMMDIANERGGLMIGTGDLSELCLGWTTYSGDHMSMYGVNASIPKTLVKYLILGYAILHPECADSLRDIEATPISPELLPTDTVGNIAQKTEDKIGPYELQDFFIYHFLRFGYRPKKLFLLASKAFEGAYDKATIIKWMEVFFTRFFRNEFKRSCLPDGAKVGTVAISPRGDLRMPSDASVEDYLFEIDSLKIDQ